LSRSDHYAAVRICSASLFRGRSRVIHRFDFLLGTKFWKPSIGCDKDCCSHFIRGLLPRSSRILSAATRPGCCSVNSSDNVIDCPRKVAHGGYSAWDRDGQTTVCSSNRSLVIVLGRIRLANKKSFLH